MLFSNLISNIHNTTVRFALTSIYVILIHVLLCSSQNITRSSQTQNASDLVFSMMSLPADIVREFMTQNNSNLKFSVPRGNIEDVDMWRILNISGRNMTEETDMIELAQSTELIFPECTAGTGIRSRAGSGYWAGGLGGCWSDRLWYRAGDGNTIQFYHGRYEWMYTYSASPGCDGSWYFGPGVSTSYNGPHNQIPICERCAVGKYSSIITMDGKTTYICEDCPSGSYSRSGSVGTGSCSQSPALIFPECTPGNGIRSKASTGYWAGGQGGCLSDRLWYRSGDGNTIQFHNERSEWIYSYTTGPSCGEFRNFGPESSPSYNGPHNQIPICEICPIKKYSSILTIDGGTTYICNDCPVDTISIAGSNNISECKCMYGYTQPGRSSCTACAAGEFLAYAGQTKCTQCPGGTFSVQTGLSIVSDTGATTMGYQKNTLAFQCGADGATKCKTWMSTTYSWYVTDRVIDNDVITVGLHTGYGTNQYWAIDFEYSKPVYNVLFWDRLDGWSYREDGFQVYIGSYRQNGTSFIQDTNNALCYTDTTNDWTKRRPAVIQCNGMSGRYLYVVQRSGVSEYFNFNEISININPCTYCPANTYNNMLGATTCSQCPLNTIQPVQGQTVCTTCAIGKYTSAVGQSTCTVCNAGEFLAYPGQTKCTQCPSGTYSGSVGLSVAIDNITIDMGYQRQTLAFQCGEDGTTECNTWRSTGFDEYVASRAIDNDAMTLGVSTGYGTKQYWAIDFEYSRPIYIVLFWDRTDQYADRENGFQVYVGSSRQTGTSFVQNTNNALCYTDTTKDGKKRRPAEIQCNGMSGRYLYVVQGDNVNGYFHFNEISINVNPCTYCPANTYNNVLGATVCKQCPLNSISIAGSNDISACKCIIGYYKSSASSCSTCAAGEFFAYPGQTKCTQCPGGTYSGSVGLSVASDNGTINMGYQRQTLAFQCGEDGATECNTWRSTGFDEYVASRAIDNDAMTLGVLTEYGTKQYWAIDFEYSRPIYNVLFWDRTDPYADRENGFQVYVGSSRQTGTSFVQNANNALCYTDTTNDRTKRRPAEIQCNGMSGRYLYIVQGNKNVDALNFNEISINVNPCTYCPANTYNNVLGATACSQCPSNTNSPKGSVSPQSCTVTTTLPPSTTAQQPSSYAVVSTTKANIIVTQAPANTNTPSSTQTTPRAVVIDVTPTTPRAVVIDVTLNKQLYCEDLAASRQFVASAVQNLNVYMVTKTSLILLRQTNSDGSVTSTQCSGSTCPGCTPRPRRRMRQLLQSVSSSLRTATVVVTDYSNSPVPVITPPKSSDLISPVVGIVESVVTPFVDPKIVDSSCDQSCIDASVNKAVVDNNVLTTSSPLIATTKAQPNAVTTQPKITTKIQPIATTQPRTTTKTTPKAATTTPTKTTNTTAPPSDTTGAAVGATIAVIVVLLSVALLVKWLYGRSNKNTPQVAPPQASGAVTTVGPVAVGSATPTLSKHYDNSSSVVLGGIVFSHQMVPHVDTQQKQELILPGFNDIKKSS